MKLFKKFVAVTGARNLSEFEHFVKLATEVGISHVSISGLSQRTDYGGEDKDSRWCEWSVYSSSILKHSNLPEMGSIFPEKFIKTEIEFLKEKHKIVRKYGLKAAYIGTEPHWLPEKIFQKHPSWRGPRVDNPMRTRRAFFAPCVDNPEVLNLYRRAVKEIVKAAPLIDTFVFHTNDAGGGFCWAKPLYNNPNGPSLCRGKDMGKRVVGFLRTIRQGAGDAGGKADVFLEAVFFQEELGLIRSLLEPGMGFFTEVISAAQPGKQFLISALVGDPQQFDIVSMEQLGKEFFIFSLDIGGYGFWPLDGFFTPVALLEKLERLRKVGAENVLFGGAGDSATFSFSPRSDISYSIIKEFQRNDSQTELARLNILKKVAIEAFGTEVVDEVVEAWYRLSKAQIAEDSVNLSLEIMVGPVMNRWLVRPLVPFPEELTDDERGYWQDFVYQNEEGLTDLLNNLTVKIIKTYYHAVSLSAGADKAIAYYQEAIELLESAKSQVKSANAKKELELLIWKIKARICVIKNYQHTITFQTLIYERQRSGEPVREVPSWAKGSRGLTLMYELMRKEIENCYQLIEILKKAPEPIFNLAQDSSWEGTFYFGADLVKQIEKKIKIIQKHWRDPDRLFLRPILGG